MSERISGINYGRIKWCCDERNITVGELFSLLGLTQRAQALFHQDLPAFTFSQLENIANFFDRDVLFFTESEIPDVSAMFSPQFRTISSEKPELSVKIKSLIEKAEKHREIFISLQDDLEITNNESTPWRSKIPAAALEGSFKQRANAIRDWLNLDSTSNSNFDHFRERLESIGVLVFVSNGYAGDWQIPKGSKVRGISLSHPTLPIIIVKKESFAAPQSFTLFHELAHLIIHNKRFADDEEDFNNYSGQENEANSLAGLILLPDFKLDQLNIHSVNWGNPDSILDELREFRNAWGVSTEVILRRLIDEHKIGNSVYSSFDSWQKANPIILPEPRQVKRHRHSEPLRIFGRKFVSLVLDALSHQRLSMNKASSFLDNIQIKDIHKLESRCARA